MNESEQQISSLPISWMGRFLYRFIPYRRRLILANITQVYGARLANPYKIHLAKAFYSHFALSIKEAIYLRFMSEDALRDKVRVIGEQYLFEIAAQNKGILILTGHFGNWEFAPLGGILHFKTFQGTFHFIRRTLGFKSLEKLLFKNYYQAGLNVIPKKNSLEQVCVALEKNHAVVFVLDQHASLVNRDGIAVEFFGKKAGTYRSLATFSQHTGTAVVPAAGYRLPNGHHVLEFFAPIPWQDSTSRKDALYHNTLRYNQALERIILAHPNQWNWLHKRWKI